MPMANDGFAFDSDFESVVNHLERASEMLKEAGLCSPEVTASNDSSIEALPARLERKAFPAEANGPSCSPSTWNASPLSQPFHVQGLGLKVPDAATVNAVAEAARAKVAEEKEAFAIAEAFALAASSGAEVGGNDLMLERRRSSVGFAIVPPAGAAVFGAFKSVWGGIGSVADAVGGGIGNVAGAVGGGIAAGGRGVVKGVSTAGRGLFKAVATADTNDTAVSRNTGGGGGAGNRPVSMSLAEAGAALVMTEEERDTLMKQLARADAMLVEEQAELKTQEAEIYAAKFLEAVAVESKLKRMEEVLKEEEKELEWQEKVMAIDKKENEENPEEGPGGKRAAISIGNDAFSEDMATQGLKHLKGGKEEVRLTHSMLPPTLDIMASFSGGGVDGGGADGGGADRGGADGVGGGEESHGTEGKAGTATRSAPTPPPPPVAAASEPSVSAGDGSVE